MGFLLFLGGLVAAGAAYVLLRPNMRSTQPFDFYLRSNMTYVDLLESLEQNVLEDPRGFDLLAERMNLRNHMYPGIYRIQPGWSSLDLVRYIRSGKREEVNVVIPSHIRPLQVFGILDRALEADSSQIADAFFESRITEELGLKEAQWSCIFQANTYRFNWATEPSQIAARFEKEFRSFWTDSRKQKAAERDLSPAQIIILASIVDGESTKMEEMPTIAGVYLNRLRNGWPLQADPTLMYIVREQGRQRVLNKDKELDHPFNTYLRKGLPPGPIMLASSAAIQAVLEPEDHDYMFFCAREDFSGFHRFAVSYEEHQRNARAYQRELNRRGILE